MIFTIQIHIWNRRIVHDAAVCNKGLLVIFMEISTTALFKSLTHMSKWYLVNPFLTQIWNMWRSIIQKNFNCHWKSTSQSFQLLQTSDYSITSDSSAIYQIMNKQIVFPSFSKNLIQRMVDCKFCNACYKNLSFFTRWRYAAQFCLDSNIKRPLLAKFTNSQIAPRQILTICQA